MGTSLGDLLAEKLGLGYAQALEIFGAAILSVTVAYYGLKANAVLAFWIAYILTRPLGASTGDLLSQSPGDGGPGFGMAGTSAMFLLTIVILVIYLSVTERDQAPVPVRVSSED